MMSTVLTMGVPAGERVYGGKTATQRRTERREKLLDTGLELFGTRGYQATSIELLCSSASLNARYFYEEFETREGLLQAIYDRHVEAVFGAVAAAVAAAPPTPTDQLTAGLSAFVHNTLADPRAARINYFEMVGVSAALEARRREVLRRYADLSAAQLAQLLPAGATPPGGDLRMAAVALVSATDGLIIDRLSAAGGTPPTAAELDRIVDALTGLFSAAITG
jgi:AcrR family transcriptional regulator